MVVPVRFCRKENMLADIFKVDTKAETMTETMAGTMADTMVSTIMVGTMVLTWSLINVDVRVKALCRCQKY